MQSENKHGVMEWQGTEALVLPSFGKSLFAFLGEEKYFIHVCVCVHSRIMAIPSGLPLGYVGDQA